MMKTVLTLILALSATAFADKTFESADDGTTHDCSADGRVNINYGGATLSLTGTCTEININASGTKITAADADAVNINGGKNTVTTATLGAATINGAGNKVTYKKAKAGKKAGASILGKGNAVTKVK
ncbi:MAG: DUF3060 domain-containing protein [Polyangiales bacterium]